MPILFLITYIIISFLIFKKNKNKTETIPFLIRISWIIIFALMFLFIVYYSEINLNSIELEWYKYSFYFLFVSYLIIFLYYVSKYRKILKQNIDEKALNIEEENYKWVFETWINRAYFIIIILLSWLYFYLLFYDLDEVLILLYMFFVCLWVFVLFEKKILYKD